jgi:hypothetical protein
MFRKPKAVITVFALVACSVLLLWQAPSYAATSKIYLTPAHKRVQVGHTFTMQLRISPATSVNAVQATVHYNTHALKLTSHSLGVFTLCGNNSAGGGSVALACTMSGSSTSRNSLISSMTFKALTSHGNSGVTITDAKAAHAGRYVASSSSNASVSFAPKPDPQSKPQPQPKPTPESGPTPTPILPRHHVYKKPSSGSHTSSTNKHDKSSKKKHHKKASSKNGLVVVPKRVQFTRAKITVTSKIKGHVYARYGTNQKKLTKKTSKTPISAKHHATLQLKKLTPGTKYYYQVVLEPSGGKDKKDVKSKIIFLSTKGYTVHIKVFGQKYYPLANQPVTLHSTPSKATTNQEGVATFKNVAPGAHELQYTSQGKTYSSKVYVASNMTIADDGSQTAKPQTIAAVLSAYTNPSAGATANADQSTGLAAWQITLIAVAATILIIAIVLRIFFFRKLSFIHFMSKRYTVSQIAHFEKIANASQQVSTTRPQSHPSDTVRPNDQSSH